MQMKKRGNMRALITKLIMMVLAILFFICIVYFAITVLPYQEENGVSPIFILGSLEAVGIFFGASGLVGYLCVMLLPDRTKATPAKKWHLALWLFAFLISIPFALTKALFGANEVEPILVFLRDNQMDDITSVGLDGFTKPLALWGAVLVTILISSLVLRHYKRHFGKVLVAISVILLAISPLVQYITNTLIPNIAQKNFVIHERFQPPVVLSKPTQQKNLVLIYLESVERSYGMIPEFQKQYQPIKDLAARGIELTNIVQTTGTNYTIAGMVATQCGVPLMTKGLQGVFFRTGVEGSMPNFLPSLHCLGDQLRQDGYTLSYLNGASLDKFSKRVFLSDHGYTRLFDKALVSDTAKQGRDNIWGLNDALLFEHVDREFDLLSSQDAPFVLSLLTLSTHGPDAFLDRDCAPQENVSSQIPRAIECTGKLVTKLVEKIQNSPAGKNTVIAIMSDHLAFFNSVQTQLDTVAGKRRNLFMLLGADAPQQINRKIAPFDIYPTLLETLGYELKDGRANLGYALSATSQNLVEELGVATINKVFTANQPLARFLWQAP